MLARFVSTAAFPIAIRIRRFSERVEKVAFSRSSAIIEADTGYRLRLWKCNRPVRRRTYQLAPGFEL